MRFNFLKYILPPEEKKFFSLFEQSAEICCQSALLFQEIISQTLTPERFNRALDLKHKSLALSEQTMSELSKTFVTPIDREDILHVAFLLNKITKRIIRGCVNLKVYRLSEHPDMLKLQSDTLAKAAVELKTVVALLRKIDTFAPISESNNRMMEIEREGDHIYFNAIDELFSGKHEALHVIKLRDIFKTIESALDNCYNVSDTIVHISLKYS